MGLLWFHLPHNWAAHSCMAIHPCRLPPAGHGVQLVERPFLAVPTWSACCQIMVRPEDFPLRKDEKGFFDRPTFHIQYLDNAQIIWLGPPVSPNHSTKGPTTTLALDGREYRYHQQIDWVLDKWVSSKDSSGFWPQTGCFWKLQCSDLWSNRVILENWWTCIRVNLQTFLKQDEKESCSNRELSKQWPYNLSVLALYISRASDKWW